MKPQAIMVRGSLTEPVQSKYPLPLFIISIKLQSDHSNMRQNIALLARLEIAQDKNKKLQVERQHKKHSMMQNKLAELREKDYRKHHPPKPITLPKYQLPSPDLAKWTLNGERYLPRHFKNLCKDFEEEKFAKHQAGEPRIMSKVLDLMQNEMNREDKRKQVDDKPLQIDKEKVLEGLPLLDGKLLKPLVLAHNKKETGSLINFLMDRRKVTVSPYRKFRAVAISIVRILFLYRITKSFKK
jgi:hypothetical protein